MKRSLLPVVLSLTILSGCGAGIDQARMGDWDIVIPPDAAPAVTYAAEEFRALFARATGQKLPIVHELRRPDRHVFVGHGPDMRDSSAGFDGGDLGPEDLRIAVAPDNIAIAGGSPRGTLYGVYTYLERHLGVRFLTADHTHVPRVGATHVVPAGTYTYRPPLAFRYCNYGANHFDPAFATRLRNNAIAKDARLGGRTAWRLINHSVSRWISVTRLGKDHPDYFAMVDGKRLASVPGDHYLGGGTQPCMTHPDVRRRIVEGVLAELKTHPEWVNISVSQNDNRKYCRCDRCRKIDEHEGSPMGSLLTLVNEVATAVAKEHPNVTVGTLAYQYSRRPPKHVRPRPNVAIQLCSIECSLLDPIHDANVPANAAFCKDLAGWADVSSNVYVWHYNVNFHDYLAPCPNLRSIGPTVRTFAERKIRGLFMQAAGGARAADMEDLRNYLISHLMWDPSRDDRALIEEFLTLHYGRAAGPIREYLDLIHDNVAARKLHRLCFARPSQYGIDEKIAATGMALFEKALRLAETDDVRRRVEKASLTMLRMAVEPAVAWVNAHKKVTHDPKNPWPPKIEVTKPLPAEVAAKQRPHVRKFLDACRKHRVTLFSERLPIQTAEDLLRQAFKLAPKEAW